MTDEVAYGEGRHQQPDGHHERPRPHTLDDETGERRGEHAAGAEGQHMRQVDGAELGEERAGDGHGDEELGEAHGADHRARCLPRADQGRGDEWPPAAAADGVEKAADQPERRRKDRPGVFYRQSTRGAHQDEHAHDKQIGGDEGADGLPFDVGQDIGAEHAAGDAGYREPKEQGAVHVAVREVRGAGHRGGRHLSGVHDGARMSRRHPESEHEARRDEPEGHAERAVDELRDEA